MSSISSVTGRVPTTNVCPAVARKSGASTAASVVRDSDGDYDGTKLGQIDSKDFGKGSRIDRRA